MSFCKLIIISIFMVGVLSACGTTSNAVFVTKSSISVLDIDSTPSSVSFAYDRDEGFYGPNYENGSVPPVVGYISTDGDIINPEIKQIYATGDAASIVVDENYTTYSSTQSDDLTGDKKPMVFATSTTFGFKIGTIGVHPSFTLGYKRKEVSFIPLRTKNGVDEYSSVIASIDTSLKDNNKFENGQFFATGEAAKILATKKYIKDMFNNTAKTSLDIFDDNLAKQKTLHSNIVRCLFSITMAQWESVISSGKSASLVADLDVQLNQAYKKYALSSSSDDKLSLIHLYSEAIYGGIDADSNNHSVLLDAHEKLICGYN